MRIEVRVNDEEPFTIESGTLDPVETWTYLLREIGVLPLLQLRWLVKMVQGKDLG